MNETINVNLIPSKVGNVLNFSQYDVGRVSKISLQNGDEAYTIPTGATVTIEATKPSGFGFSEACAFSGNEVTITTTATMTLEAGRFPAELVITNSGVVIGTANFIMNVEESPHPTGTPDGDKEEILNEIQLYVTNLVNSELDGKVDEIVAELEPMIPTKTSDLTNDSGFITSVKDSEGNVFTKNSSNEVTVPNATASKFGLVKVDVWNQAGSRYVNLISSNITTKIPVLRDNLIEASYLPSATSSVKGAVIVDNAMSDSSTNPVQNSVVKAYVDAHTGTISATSDGAGTVTIEMV